MLPTKSFTRPHTIENEQAGLLIGKPRPVAQRYKPSNSLTQDYFNSRLLQGEGLSSILWPQT